MPFNAPGTPGGGGGTDPDAGGGGAGGMIVPAIGVAALAFWFLR
jgi:hypothetical protein